MRWIEACIPINGGEIDEICLQLADLGVGGMTVEDEAEFHDFLENNHQYWDYVEDELEQSFSGVSRIKFYASDDEDGAALLRTVRAAGFAAEVSYIEDSDWENNWREYYKPIPIGEKLLVIPEWEPAPEGNSRALLRLDPGLIFGTGSHATTRMCLKKLEEFSGAGKTVLDLGCGSGILGIGALVLGCERVAGCDIDPKAPDVAASNAALNGFGGETFRILAGDILADAAMQRELAGKYDLVLANIVADVIIPLSAAVPQYMAEGAHFITSGIIEGREDEVRAAIEKNGLRITESLTEEGWWCFVCEK